MTPNELVLTFGGLHVCVQFGKNRRRNATGRVSTDGHTHTRTHARTDAKRFYYLSHAICYSYGADNHTVIHQTGSIARLVSVTCCVCGRLAVTGKQVPVPAVTYTLPTSRSSRSSTPTDLSHYREEVIEQNGDVEEILAIDNISLAGGLVLYYV